MLEVYSLIRLGLIKWANTSANPIEFILVDVRYSSFTQLVYCVLEGLVEIQMKADEINKVIRIINLVDFDIFILQHFSVSMTKINVNIHMRYTKLIIVYRVKIDTEKYC